MSHTNAAALQTLALSLGLALVFNDEGICDLLVDDDTIITLEGPPDERRCKSTASWGICPMPTRPTACAFCWRQTSTAKGQARPRLASTMSAARSCLENRLMCVPWGLPDWSPR